MTIAQQYGRAYFRAMAAWPSGLNVCVAPIGSSWAARSAHFAALLVALIAPCGCTDDSRRTEADDTNAEGGTLPDARGPDAGNAAAALRESYRGAAQKFDFAPADWQPCPLLTDGADTAAECARVEVPLSWLEPEGSTTTVFVKRLPTTGPPKQQVWLLPGGPGGAGNSVEAAAALLRNSLPDAEFLVADYRGTGRSERLACPEEEDAAGFFPGGNADPAAYRVAAERCFTALESKVPDDVLRNFNTTETAADLGMLAAKLRSPEAELIIYGVSFGTYVAQRYLQLFPEQPDAVVLDSLVPPAGFTHRDEDVDRVARKILESCAGDPDCSGHLGDDPEGFAEDVVHRLENGHCPALASAGIDAERLRVLAGSAVLDTARRPFLPALYFRADRCEPADVDALVKYAVPDPPTPTTVPFSELLQNLVLRSELSEENLRDASRPLVAHSNETNWTRAIWDVTPAYPRDAFYAQWAHTDANVFVLQGELDANTPSGNGEAARDHLQAASMQFVSLPNTGHAVILNFACGWPLIGAFMQDPAAPVDLSCTAELPPQSFVVSPDQATARFGQADLWANAPL